MDVGGTKISAGLVNQKHQIINSERFLTEIKKGKKAIINNIINAVSCFYTSSTKAIGLGIIGQVDWQKGVSAFDAKFKNWHNVHIAKILQKKFKVPVFLDNDAKIFTLYESVFGLGKKYKYVGYNIH